MSSGADFNRDEELMARRDGARLVKNSGRGERKGDAIYETDTSTFMLDYKFTDAKSFSLNLEKFKALEKQAWREGHDAIMVSVFRKENSRAIAMIDWDLLKTLLEKAGLHYG